MPHIPGHFEQTEEQRKAAFSAAGVPLPQSLPKIGEPIPGTNLKFEAADIANLQSGDTTGITSEDLTPVTPPKITQPESVFIPDIQSIPTTEPTTPTTPAPISPLISDIESTTARILGQEAEVTKRVGEAVSGPERELADINKQIKLLQAQELKATGEAEERGETLGFAAGETARVRRNFAIEALRLSALSEALQGNIALAEKQAKRSVDLEFAEEKKKLEAQRKNILDNFDKFTPAEKKRAEAALARIDKQDAFVEEQKKIREDNTKLAQDAIRGGADNSTAQKIAESNTREEGLNLAAPFLKPETTFEQRLDAQGNLVEFERDARGRVISQRIISTKAPTTDIADILSLMPAGTLTKEQQQQIIKERIQKLPAGQQDQAFQAIGVFKNGADIVKLLERGVRTGPISGRVREGISIFGIPILPGKRALGLANADELQFDAATTAFTANFIKAISGVQVSDREREFLMKALPSPTNQENVNRENIKILLQFLKNKYETQLGINFTDFPDEIPLQEDRTNKLEELFKKFQ